jgi:short subunit dehydrogenase-like uncharacterized protein
MKRWMIYGANGYTGRLIAEAAVARGERPLLAGRGSDAVRALASSLAVESRAFPLTDGRAVTEALAGVSLVLNAAGPFSATAAPLVAAALANRSHYLDITGEIAVFEAIFARQREAEAAAICLIPGVGFDVVPSDCLAAQLAARVPEAVRLELAIAGTGGISRGTLKTMIEALPQGGRLRREGKIVHAPLASPTRWVSFPHRRLHVAAIPWGDVSTAFRSTGIGNITVYAPIPRTAAVLFGLAKPATALLRWERIQRLLQSRIGLAVTGPSAETRRRGRGYLWGRAEDAAGRGAEAWLETAEGYHLTAVAAVECARRVLAGEVAPGAWTPSQAFGADFVLGIPGTQLTPL